MHSQGEIVIPGSYPPSPANDERPAVAYETTPPSHFDPKVRHPSTHQKRSLPLSMQSYSRDESQRKDQLSYPLILTPIPLRETAYEAAADVPSVRPYQSLETLPQSSFDARKARAHLRLIERKPTPFPMKGDLFGNTVPRPEEILGRVDSGTKIERRGSNHVNFQTSGEHDGTKYYTSPGRMQRPSIDFDIDHETTKLQFHSLGRAKGKEIAVHGGITVELDDRQAHCGANLSRSSLSIASVGAKRQASLSDATSAFHPGFHPDLNAAREHVPYSGVRDSPLHKGPHELRHLTGAKRRLRGRPVHDEDSSSLASQDRVSARSSHDDCGSTRLFPEKPTVHSPLHQEPAVSSPSSSFMELREYTGETPSPFPRRRRQMASRTGPHAPVEASADVTVNVCEVDAEEEDDEDGEDVVEGRQAQSADAHEEVDDVQRERETRHGRSGLWNTVKRAGKEIKGVFSGKRDGTGGRSKLIRIGHGAKSKIWQVLKKAGRENRG